MHAVMSLKIKNTGKAPRICPQKVANASQMSVRRFFFFFRGQGILRGWLQVRMLIQKPMSQDNFGDGYASVGWMNYVLDT
jgi:hypothetical protein